MIAPFARSFIVAALRRGARPQTRARPAAISIASTRIENAASARKYKPRFQVLNAADYGVPQLRKRVIMLAARDGSAPRFPVPTHASASEGPLLPGMEAHRTAWDALGDEAPSANEELAMRGAWADLLPSIPEGNNYLFHTDRGGGLPLFGWRRRYWSFLLKVAKNQPSWTIQAQPGPAIGPFHWKSRRLSMRELCRIQTFPEDIEITGSRQAVQKQVGNAVPSLLAEVIAREVRVQLLGLKAVRGGPKLIPAVRAPVPAAEPLAAVPKKFQKLKGEHEAHPGTGKGYGAVEREQAAQEQS